MPTAANQVGAMRTGGVCIGGGARSMIPNVICLI